ncbi:MAG: MBL fold metallo-hydrolase [Chloroflexi bacterium]|nr:MBL fold metallo-hydrolase [Chloroflexota bacterium]
MIVIASDRDIQIEKLELRGGSETHSFTANTYVLTCQKTKECVVVDAPGEIERIVEAVKGRKPRYILITHHHHDHTEGLVELKSKLGVPVAAHPAEAKKLPAPADIFLEEGGVVSFGDIRLKVIHTPGHTSDSICLLTGSYLIAGDTIFPHGPGHTRTPKDLEQVIDSITRKIFVLPDDTQVFSGHGETTVLKNEKAEFAVFSARQHDPNLAGDVLWLSA